MKSDDLEVRAADERDTPFIVDSWLRSFAKRNPEVSWQVYRHEQLQVIGELAKGDDLLVAFSPLDRDLVLGWLACEAVEHELVVDYMHVKPTFREQGVEALLLATARKLHPECDSLVSTHKQLEGSTFNPYSKFRRRTFNERNE